MCMQAAWERVFTHRVLAEAIEANVIGRGPTRHCPAAGFGGLDSGFGGLNSAAICSVFAGATPSGALSA